MLFKTPSGYVQQSPWLGIVNKQLELMGRYMVELGLTPASRSRVIGGGGPSVGLARAVWIDPADHRSDGPRGERTRRQGWLAAMDGEAAQSRCFKRLARTLPRAAWRTELRNER